MANYAYGDSITVGLAPYLRQAGVAIDAEVGRRVPAVLASMAAHGPYRRRDRIICNVGTNGGLGRDDAAAIVALAHPAMLWLVTIRDTHSWAARTNNAIRGVCGLGPGRRGHLLDWALLSHGQRGWYADDGIHPNVLGRHRLAHLYLLVYGAT